MTHPDASRLVARALARAALVLAFLAPLAAPRLARAQYYYPPPPPPPPPPPVGVYHPYGAYEYGRRAPEERSALDLGFDAEGTAPINMPTLPDGNRIQGGSGFKLRIGEQILVGPGLHVTPEVGYAYDHLFAADDYGNAFSWDMDRLFAGVRFSFGRFLVPSIYGHVGVGWRMTGDPSLATGDGIAGDFGGALDVRFWHHFQFGAHVEYVSVDVTPYAPQWLALGLHVDLVL